MESYNDENKFDPQLIISMSSPDNEITELLEKVIEFLDNDSIWNQNDFEEYLKTAPDEILKNGYRDPFLSFIRVNALLTIRRKKTIFINPRQYRSRFSDVLSLFERYRFT